MDGTCVARGSRPNEGHTCGSRPRRPRGNFVCNDCFIGVNFDVEHHIVIRFLAAFNNNVSLPEDVVIGVTIYNRVTMTVVPGFQSSLRSDNTVKRGLLAQTSMSVNAILPPGQYSVVSHGYSASFPAIASDDTLARGPVALSTDRCNPVTVVDSWNTTSAGTVPNETSASALLAGTFVYEAVACASAAQFARQPGDTGFSPLPMPNSLGTDFDVHEPIYVRSLAAYTNNVTIPDGTSLFVGIYHRDTQELVPGLSANLNNATSTQQDLLAVSTNEQGVALPPGRYSIVARGYSPSFPAGVGSQTPTIINTGWCPTSTPKQYIRFTGMSRRSAGLASYPDIADATVQYMAGTFIFEPLNCNATAVLPKPWTCSTLLRFEECVAASCHWDGVSCGNPCDVRYGNPTSCATDSACQWFAGSCRTACSALPSDRCTSDTACVLAGSGCANACPYSDVASCLQDTACQWS